MVEIKYCGSLRRARSGRVELSQTVRGKERNIERQLSTRKIRDLLRNLDEGLIS